MFETRSERLRGVANAWNLERASIRRKFFNGVFNHSERGDSAATREMARLAAKFGTRHVHTVSIMGISYFRIFQGRDVHHLSTAELMERSRRDHELVNERAMKAIVTSVVAEGYEHLIVSMPLHAVDKIYDMGMDWVQVHSNVVADMWNGFTNGRTTGWAIVLGRRVTATLSWSCA